jgi:hypothetical protein
MPCAGLECVTSGEQPARVMRRSRRGSDLYPREIWLAAAEAREEAGNSIHRIISPPESQEVNYRRRPARTREPPPRRDDERCRTMLPSQLRPRRCPSERNLGPRVDLWLGLPDRISQALAFIQHSMFEDHERHCRIVRRMRYCQELLRGSKALGRDLETGSAIEDGAGTVAQFGFPHFDSDARD